MPDGTINSANPVTDLWSRMPALFLQACEHGIAMEVEIADAMLAAMREINSQQFALMKAGAPAADGDAAARFKVLGETASKGASAIAKTLGDCSRRILEANQACMLRSLGAMTAATPSAKPAEPLRKAAH